MQILLTLLALYFLLALFVMLVQRKLIYFPAKLSPEMATQLAQREGFVPWRNAAGAIIGWHLPAKGTSTASVLIVHGNAGSALHRGYIAESIHSVGNINVFVLEYPGYGCRPGSPSQTAILAAAEEAFAVLVDQSPVYIVSESLGAGAAAHLAGRNPTKVAGLAFFAPFDNLASVGQAQMPFLPVHLLMWDQFRPAVSLRDYRGPIKVVIAEADTIIPAKFGRKLYDSYSGPKSIEVIPGAGHNDIAAQPREWWRDVFLFWRTNGLDESASQNFRKRSE